jgi:hypothetical protein
MESRGNQEVNGYRQLNDHPFPLAGSQFGFHSSVSKEPDGLKLSRRSLREVAFIIEIKHPF